MLKNQVLATQQCSYTYVYILKGEPNHENFILKITFLQTTKFLDLKILGYMVCTNFGRDHTNHISIFQLQPTFIQDCMTIPASILGHRVIPFPLQQGEATGTEQLATGVMHPSRRYTPSPNQIAAYLLQYKIYIMFVKYLK